MEEPVHGDHEGEEGYDTGRGAEGQLQSVRAQRRQRVRTWGWQQRVRTQGGNGGGGHSGGGQGGRGAVKAPLTRLSCLASSKNKFSMKMFGKTTLMDRMQR
jgi:hypothetical protein